MIRGVFRDNEDWVRVRYSNGLEIDMTGARYVALRLQPAFDQLPQEDDVRSPLVDNNSATHDRLRARR